MNTSDAQKTLFRQTTLKLAAVYFVILVIVVTFYSYNWYQVSAGELDRRDRREELVQDSGLQQFRPPRIDPARAEEIKEAILSRIIIVDIIMVTTGAIGSYYLARLSLEPIEKAHQKLANFTSDASHELRTPLANMQTEIDVALASKKLSVSSAKTVLSSNLEEIARMKSITNNLLKLAREQQPQLQPVDLRELADGVIKAHKDSISKTKAKITNNIKPKSTIQTDPEILAEIMSIILDNGLKYSDGQPQITLDYRASEGKGTLSIADQGIGIDPSQQNEIFERFYKVDESRTGADESGFGLGLAVAKSLANSLGYVLNVQSQPARGSQFNIVINVSKENIS